MVGRADDLRSNDRDYYWTVSPHPEDPNYTPPSTVPVTYEDGITRAIQNAQQNAAARGTLTGGL